MTDINDLNKYRTDHQGQIWLYYEFPNGRSASVSTDLNDPLRFAVQVSTPDVVTPAVEGLTTEQVEAKLAAVFALPAEPEPTVAWVTVDERGLLIPSEDGQPGSTVTVGDDTRPVPAKVEHGGVMWWPRVSCALREIGWRPVRGEFGDESTPGAIVVPVERIETKEG